MIRITGGINRSRLLDTPETELTKPTMDKVRLGVFSALGDDIKNANILDLFAGSGSYGFESLSRGARFVTFVDKSLLAYKSIIKNAQNLRENNIKVEIKDCVEYVKDSNIQFDVIFMDPPYKLNVYNEILEIIESNNLLTEHGIIVMESEKELEFDETKYQKVRFYKYGLAKIYLLRR